MKKTVLLLIIINVFMFNAYSKDSIGELFSKSYKHEKDGEYTNALNSVLKILREDSKNYVAALRSGWLFYLIKDYEESVRYYDIAYNINTKSIEPLLGMSLPLMALKNYKHTEYILDLVIKSDKNNYTANSRMAYILYLQEKYSEALNYYLRINKLYPSDTTIILGLGWTYLKLRQKRNSYYAFSYILEINKDNLEAVKGLNALKRI